MGSSDTHYNLLSHNLLSIGTTININHKLHYTGKKKIATTTTTLG